RRVCHRRFGEMDALLSKRRYRPSGELYPRRLQRMSLWSVRRGERPYYWWRFTQTPYSFQTVFPSTIVRTARPFSFQPSNGELRDADSNLSILTVHSKSGSISVTSAGAPIDSGPGFILNRRAC